MNKCDLIDEVSAMGNMPRNESEVVVEKIFERILLSLSPGNTVEIRGFGSFGIGQHQAREIRNPKTQARVQVPAKRIPYFQPSKTLKKFVNNPSVPLAPPPRTRSRRPPKT